MGSEFHIIFMYQKNFLKHFFQSLKSYFRPIQKQTAGWIWPTGWSASPCCKSRCTHTREGTFYPHANPMKHFYYYPDSEDQEIVLQRCEVTCSFLTQITGRGGIWTDFRAECVSLHQGNTGPASVAWCLPGLGLCERLELGLSCCFKLCLSFALLAGHLQ